MINLEITHIVLTANGVTEYHQNVIAETLNHAEQMGIDYKRENLQGCGAYINRRLTCNGHHINR